jgi:hypothetical protein
MKLEVLRFSDGEDSTSGLLFDVTNERRFLAYTLEDEFRVSKKYGETRIPDGIYKIKLRKTGGFHQKYSSRFYDIHKGMLHITDVPGFEYILIHCGNTDEHTHGCLLVGDTQNNNMLEKDGFIGRSKNAYKRIYPDIADAIEKGEEVLIEYKGL